MRKKKCTNVEKAERLRRVMDLLGMAKKRFEICLIMKEEYGIVESMTDKYIAEATEIIKNYYTEDRLTNMYEHLYNLALQQKQTKTAREVADSISKLKKLDNSQPQINLNIQFGEEDNTNDTTTEEGTGHID